MIRLLHPSSSTLFRLRLNLWIREHNAQLPSPTKISMVLLRVMLIWPTNGHLYLHLSPKKIPSSIIAQCYQYTNLLSETRHVKLELQHTIRHHVKTSHYIRTWTNLYATPPLPPRNRQSKPTALLGKQINSSLEPVA